MPLNHYTYLKNLMTMILYILYEILAFNKSLHIFEKFDDLILFYHLKYFFYESLYSSETLINLIHYIFMKYIFSMNHYELLKYKLFMILFASL